MTQTMDIKSIRPSRSNALSNSISYVNSEHVFHKETIAYCYEIVLVNQRCLEMLLFCFSSHVGK